jgi:hypothetical protein
VQSPRFRSVQTSDRLGQTPGCPIRGAGRLLSSAAYVSDLRAARGRTIRSGYSQNAAKNIPSFLDFPG